jgi:hypothetical protein
MNFENWYLEEFEPGGEGAELQHLDDSNTGKINVKTGGMMSTYKGDSLLGGDDMDDDALAYIRAKRKVDTLHKAKKLEKSRPGLK